MRWMSASHNPCLVVSTAVIASPNAVPSVIEFARMLFQNGKFLKFCTVPGRRAE